MLKNNDNNCWLIKMTFWRILNWQFFYVKKSQKLFINTHLYFVPSHENCLNFTQLFLIPQVFSLPGILSCPAALPSHLSPRLFLASERLHWLLTKGSTLSLQLPVIGSPTSLQHSYRTRYLYGFSSPYCWWHLKTIYKTLMENNNLDTIISI